MDREQYLRLLLSGYRELRIEAPEWLLTECAELSMETFAGAISGANRDQVLEVFAVIDTDRLRRNKEFKMEEKDGKWVAEIPVSGYAIAALIKNERGERLVCHDLESKVAIAAGDSLTIELSESELSA
jgi:hypothetical protein